MTSSNLRRLYDAADAIDRREGQLAYARYGVVLRQIAERYLVPYERVVAAFVALSPNSDYAGNLRSLVSVLEGVNAGRPSSEVTVATYGHCRDRAYTYAAGAVDFLSTVRGPKIRSFYLNIIDPDDIVPVTIDGHMVGAWHGDDRTMKNAIIRRREYDEIAAGVRELAAELDLVPNALQATIWFTRKRTLRVKYSPQMSLFAARDDAWGTLVDVASIRPYIQQ